MNPNPRLLIIDKERVLIFDIDSRFALCRFSFASIKLKSKARFFIELYLAPVFILDLPPYLSLRGVLYVISSMIMVVILLVLVVLVLYLSYDIRIGIASKLMISLGFIYDWFRLIIYHLRVLIESFDTYY